MNKAKAELLLRRMNSAQQVRNVLQGFSVKRDILSRPVILVDDVIDSGWTVTIIAALLRINGSGPVFPLR